MYHGFTTNVSKTKVMLQPRTGHYPPSGVKIAINGLNVGNVEQFHTLHVLTTNASDQMDVENWIKTAHGAYGKLFKIVFGNPGLTDHQTRGQPSCCNFDPPVLLATLPKRHPQSLKVFHQMKLRQILRNTWQDRITNNEVLVGVKMESVETLMSHNQLRWVGHFNWMPVIRLH